MQGSMMKLKMLSVAGVTGILLLSHLMPVRASEPLDLFDSEAPAVKHCGKDAVVWLDIPSHTFWVKGQKGYARTKSGGYTCRKDAMKSGNHASRG
jgi:hypothetical protein